ncbi:MAG: YitT family protein [Lachnospirales bacterium]
MRKNIILILLGCLSYSIGLNVFYLPSNLVTGGFSGLSIIITRVFMDVFGVNLPLWFLNLVLNLPFFVLGFYKIGGKFMLRSLFATVSLSAFLLITQVIPPIEIDYILSSIFGGLFCGLGLGLVFRTVTTTGGTDLVASLIRTTFFTHVSLARLLMVLDSIIVAMGMFVFGPLNTMYAIIAIFTTTKVIDNVLEGMNFAKAAIIISDKTKEINDTILADLDRGVTGLYSKGMYNNIDRLTLLTVVSNKELVKLKLLIRKIDKNAFVIVADVREVLGEGFTL